MIPRRYRDTALDAKVSASNPLDKTAQGHPVRRPVVTIEPDEIPHGTDLIER